ncbi:IS91 family transposase [Methylomarinum sp. Ch1-1]|uniref:IS91 family transposase n=1 Tax=Methylomarinum roseum TaxID=3067653 RepID=A0AAU7NR24_9GAMM|nr:IS91 family transposase [Methylomarinum sp. Ch1-1]MDP4520593.1 IS91 family transposase [Methylomarinum sp. Ch1-1]
MIPISSVIDQFEADFLNQYPSQILPSQLKALQALKICRTRHSPVMQVNCTECEHQTFVPHSCGHRNCPHCQHHESQQWIERQLQKQVPAQYFMITFTLPAQLRTLAWRHQRLLYSVLFECVWETLQTFSRNDRKLNGDPGVIAVLHTHSRALDYHPHIHAVMPAAIVDQCKRLWRTKTGKYLFNHKALAKVFRAKMLTRLARENLSLPKATPHKWVVDCKRVGSGDKALVYLGRYLYRGVIREKDILSCRDGKVTYRYQDSKTKRWQIKTVSGADFLWRVLQHVLPKGFRRARNYGFLHPNSKGTIRILQYLKKLDPQKWLPVIRQRPQMRCACCGGVMAVGRTRIPAVESMALAQTLAPI